MVREGREMEAETQIRPSQTSEHDHHHENHVVDDHDAIMWIMMAMLTMLTTTCMERKYLVAACLSCSLSSAVCLLG